MSNTSITTTTTISPDLLRAAIVLPIFDKYMIIIIYTSGSFGSLLNVLIFLQKRLRIKSCSVYFLLNSLIDFSFLNTFILMTLISLFNSKIFSSINSTNVWCKLGNYFYFILPCLTSTCLIFASIDRFCASSSSNRLHKINQLKISYLLAFLILFVWTIFALHTVIEYDFRLNSADRIQCTPHIYNEQLFVIIDGYFFASFNGIVSPLILIVFGLLIVRNINHLHRRTHPQSSSAMLSAGNRQSNIRYTQGNQHLIRMLLFQNCLTVFLNIPYVVLYLYGIYNSKPQYWLSLLLYRIFTYIARWFWFMNFSKSFYVNILCSQTFRNVLVRRLLYVFSSQQNRIGIDRSIPRLQVQIQTSYNSDYDLELTRR